MQNKFSFGGHIRIKQYCYILSVLKTTPINCIRNGMIIKFWACSSSFYVKFTEVERELDHFLLSLGVNEKFLKAFSKVKK